MPLLSRLGRGLTASVPRRLSQIRMVMIFRDFREAVLRRRRRELAFRVARPLEHFGRDYDPADPRHYITVQLPTDVAVRQLLNHLRAQVSVRLVP